MHTIDHKEISAKPEAISTSYATIYRKWIADSTGLMVRGRDSWNPTYTDEWVASSTDGPDIVLSDGIEEFCRLDVGTREYESFKNAQTAAMSLAEQLPESGLRGGVYKAIMAKNFDLLAAIRQARQESDFPIPLEDLYRAQREQFFLLSAAAGALGFDDYDLMVDLGTRIEMREGVKARNNGFRSVYDVLTETFFDMGDYEDIPQSRRDSIDFAYTGQLHVSINPQRGVVIDYIPTQKSARRYHNTESEVTGSDGDQRVYHNEGLSMRIDLDATAPCGIALDMGRSPYDGSRNGRHLKRNGDLLGRVYATVTEQGSHEYTGFTTEMRDEFRTFAEELTLAQYLRWQDRREELAQVA